MMKPDKDFSFKITFHVDEDHPLYEYSDREAIAELALFIVTMMDIDPCLGYECEVMNDDAIKK